MANITISLFPECTNESLLANDYFLIEDSITKEDYKLKYSDIEEKIISTADNKFSLSDILLSVLLHIPSLILNQHLNESTINSLSTNLIDVSSLICIATTQSAGIVKLPDSTIYPNEEQTRIYGLSVDLSGNACVHVPWDSGTGGGGNLDLEPIVIAHTIKINELSDSTTRLSGVSIKNKEYQTFIDEDVIQTIYGTSFFRDFTIDISSDIFNIKRQILNIDMSCQMTYTNGEFWNLSAGSNSSLSTYLTDELSVLGLTCETSDNTPFKTDDSFVLSCEINDNISSWFILDRYAVNGIRGGDIAYLSNMITTLIDRCNSLEISCNTLNGQLS